MTIDTPVLQTLDRKPLEEARSICLEMLKTLKENKNGSIARLIRDVTSARSSKEICGIMYRTVLAGQGLRTTNSSWNKI